jgi:hypothetical protein
MSVIEDPFPDCPDISMQPPDGTWLQIRDLVSESLVAALESQPFGSQRVTLIGGDELLAWAVGVDCDVPVAYSETTAGTPCRHSEHVVIVLLPRIQASERVELLSAAHQSVRPGGVLVVVATVVVAPGEDRRVVPSMRQLIEELHDAAGLALHVDELRSLRWYGETCNRGVLLWGTSLSLGDEP